MTGLSVLRTSLIAQDFPGGAPGNFVAVGVVAEDSYHKDQAQFKEDHGDPDKDAIPPRWQRNLQSDLSSNVRSFSRWVVIVNVLVVVVRPN